MFRNHKGDEIMKSEKRQKCSEKNCGPKKSREKGSRSNSANESSCS